MSMHLFRGLTLVTLHAVAGVAAMRGAAARPRECGSPRSVAANPPKDSQPRSMLPVVRPATPGDPARRTSVTIVADPQTQSALAKLRNVTPDDGTAPKPAKPPEKKVEPRPVAQFDVDGQQIDSQSAEARKAAELLKQYLAAKSWQEKLPLVYQSAQARPLMMVLLFTKIVPLLFFGCRPKIDSINSVLPAPIKPYTPRISPLCKLKEILLRILVIRNNG